MLNKKIEKSAKAMERSTSLLDYRRLNWRIETRGRVLKQFELFIENAKSSDLPFRFYILASEPNNEELIELKSGSTPLGIIEREQALFSTQVKVTSLTERGGSLGVSQSATGEVLFIAYPRSSDRISPKQKEIIFFRPKDPTEVTEKLIQKAICDYMLILQHSAYFSSPASLTISEKIRIFWIYLRDIRRVTSAIRSIVHLKNPWAQTIVGALFGFILGLLFPDLNGK